MCFHDSQSFSVFVDNTHFRNANTFIRAVHESGVLLRPTASAVVNTHLVMVEMGGVAPPSGTDQ